MAEYLAPGLYIEEVDTGAKPIEGVSTSTSGMVGMTERGPINVPILVTSVGEFDRWFGGMLPRDEFVDAAGRAHSYLPHAVEGFFANGGKRLFAVRAVSTHAAPATREMFWRDPGPALGETVLLRGAAQATGSVLPLYVLSPVGLAGVLRIGDGSASEYMTIAGGGVTVGTTQHIPLSARVTRSHQAASAIASMRRRTWWAYRRPGPWRQRPAPGRASCWWRRRTT